MLKLTGAESAIMIERKSEKPTVDRRLLPYLEARDESVAETELGRLYETHLEGMIRDSICQRTGIRPRAGESGDTPLRDAAGEILQKVSLSWCDRMLRMRAGEAPPIANLEAFIYRAVENSFFSYLKEKSPHRRMIKAQMYDYVERKRNADGSVLMWKVGDDVKVYGLAQHAGQEVVANANYDLLERDPNEFKNAFFSPEQQNRWILARGAKTLKGELIVEVVKEILTVIGGPVERDCLEDAIVTMTGGEAFTEVMSKHGSDDQDLPDSSGGIEQPVEPIQLENLLRLETIQSVWNLICTLHVTDRRAFILDLDRGYIVQLIANGVSAQQIADGLNVPLSRFHELYQKLPLSNQEIAELFSLKVGSVKNARSRAVKSIWRAITIFLGFDRAED